MATAHMTIFPIKFVTPGQHRWQRPTQRVIQYNDRLIDVMRKYIPANKKSLFHSN